MNLVVSTLPDEYAHRTLQFVAKQLEATQHVEFYLRWACQLLTVHGAKEDVLSGHTLLALHQNLSRKYEQLSKICDFNKYTMRVLRSVEEKPQDKNNGSDDSDDDDGVNEDDLLLVRSSKRNDDDDDDVDADMEASSSDDD